MSERVFRELSALTRAIAGSRRLDRALSAADVPGAAKRALLNDVTKGAFDAATLDAAVAAIDSSDSTAVDGLLQATIDEAFESFDVADVEVSLHAIGSLIDDNVELSQSLSNFAVKDQPKVQFLSDLFSGKVDPTALEIVSTLVFVSHGRGLARRTLDVARDAANRRNTVIADVSTAIEIDDQRKALLSSALQTALGRSVQPRFTVDPSIIGSVVVRVGDEVLDGSVRLRLEQARRAVAS